VRRSLIAWGLACAACSPSCIAPSVLARDERAVSSSVSEPSWHAAFREELLGWFESTRIEGDAAESFLEIEYYFAADGTYSGAALAHAAQGPEFQTLTGRWTLAGAEITFDGGETARVLAAPGWLRFESNEGIVVLRRVDEP